MLSFTRNLLFDRPAIVGNESNGRRSTLVAVVSAVLCGLDNCDTWWDAAGGFSGIGCDGKGGLRVELWNSSALWTIHKSLNYIVYIPFQGWCFHLPWPFRTTEKLLMFPLIMGNELSASYVCRKAELVTTSCRSQADVWDQATYVHGIESRKAFEFAQSFQHPILVVWVNAHILPSI